MGHKSHGSKRSHIKFDLANLPSILYCNNTVPGYAPNLRDQVQRVNF